MKSVENVKSFQYAEETVFRNVLKKIGWIVKRKI